MIKVKNARGWSESGPRPYMLAIVGYLLAYALRSLVNPWLHGHTPMIFLAINCLIVGYYFGFWPAFFILLPSIMIAGYAFVPPYNSFSGVTIVDVLGFAMQLLGMVLALILFEMLHRAKYEAELLGRVSATRYQLLVETDEDRRSALKQQGS